jgi:hypothetical protein
VPNLPRKYQLNHGNMKLHKMGRTAALLAATALWAVTGTSAFAALTFTGSDLSDQLAASATFDLSGGNLTVSLVNTYTGDTVDQSHVLTGIFFNYSGGTLTPSSAAIGAGSVYWQGTSSSPTDPNHPPVVLGTEWAYGTGSAPHGANAGIVSSGFYTPGSGNFAPSGDMLDGSAYGILSAGYTGSDLDGLSTRVYVQDTVNFVLTGFTGPLSQITDVSFQYGTSLSEPNMMGSPAVPEPATVFAGALLLLPFGLSTVRILRRKSVAAA